MKTCLHKNLHTNAHSSITHNSPRVETTQMSIKWRMDIYKMRCIDGILFICIRKQSTKYMAKHRRTLKILCSGKEARHQRTNGLWFHFYEEPETVRPSGEDRGFGEGRRSEWVIMEGVRGFSVRWRESSGGGEWPRLQINVNLDT